MFFLSNIEQKIGIPKEELEFTSANDLIYLFYKLDSEDDLIKLANMVIETGRDDLIKEVNYLLPNYFSIHL